MNVPERGADAEENKLLEMVKAQHKKFQDEARKHRRLFRGMWLISTVVSLLIAYLTTFSFSVNGVTSAELAAGLAILLPVLSGYIVMRSPERLWIHEISVRNRLGDLAAKIELAIDRDAQVDLSASASEYFDILRDASENWVFLKSQRATSPGTKPEEDDREKL